MKLGLCTISNKEWPVEDVLALAGEVGFDGVEIWGQDHVGDGSSETCREIRDAAADADVEIPVYGSYLRAAGESFEEDLERELRIADDLGADMIRVWPGDQTYGEHDEEHFERAVADISEASRAAADRDLGVTVEKHGNSLTETGDGAERLITEVDEPNCGLNWQPTFTLPSETLAEEAQRLSGLANNLHVQAVDERIREEFSGRSPLSEAYFDLPDLLATFADAGFDGYAELEFVTDDRPYREAVRGDYEYLREAVAAADGDAETSA